MISVKDATGDDGHTPLLMGLLFRRVVEAFDAEDWGGLRQSHFRVLATVPASGCSVTDLAARLGMTKQGCGQLVTALVDSGHLRVEGSPTDGRVRLVRRTPRGTRTHRAVSRRIARLEGEWAASVGGERYAVFRGVLEELAQASER